jgi:hypothetical protein
LLSESRDRSCSVRATILHTVDAAVTGEANRRYVDWRLTHRARFGMVREDGGEWRRPSREDFYRAYEDFEEVVRLWHEWPHRWREE